MAECVVAGNCWTRLGVAADTQYPDGRHPCEASSPKVGCSGGYGRNRSRRWLSFSSGGGRHRWRFRPVEPIVTWPESCWRAVEWCDVDGCRGRVSGESGLGRNVPLVPNSVGRWPIEVVPNPELAEAMTSGRRDEVEFTLTSGNRDLFIKWFRYCRRGVWLWSRMSRVCAEPSSIAVVKWPMYLMNSEPPVRPLWDTRKRCWKTVIHSIPMWSKWLK